MHQKDCGMRAIRQENRQEELMKYRQIFDCGKLVVQSSSPVSMAVLDHSPGSNFAKKNGHRQVE